MFGNARGESLAGSALLMVGVFSDAGRSCSPAAGEGGALAASTAASSSGGAYRSQGTCTTRSALKRGVPYGTASVTSMKSRVQPVFWKGEGVLMQCGPFLRRDPGKTRQTRPI